MATVTLCAVAEAELGPCVGELPDGTRVLVVRAQGAWHALEADCPHQYFPLENGDIQDDTLLVCPLHGWRFDVRTGQSPDSPMLRIQRWQPRVQGDWLLIDLPDTAPAET